MGGWLGRMDGGAPPKLPNIIERLLCLSPFVFVACSLYGYWGLLSLIGLFGIVTGHGAFFPQRILKKIKPERVDFLLVPFFGKDPRIELSPNFQISSSYAEYYIQRIYPKLYWRNVAGMFLTGLLVGLPAAIVALCHGDWTICGLFCLTGPIKSLSYMLGLEVKDLFKLKHLEKDTEKAEFLNGFFRTLLCGIIYALADL